MGNGKSIWAYDLFELIPSRYRISLRILRPKLFRARGLSRLFRELHIFAKQGIPLDRALVGISVGQYSRKGLLTYLGLIFVLLLEGCIILKYTNFLILEKLINPYLVVPIMLTLTLLLFITQIVFTQVYKILVTVIVILGIIYLSMPAWFLIIPMFIMLTLRLNLTNSMIGYPRFVRKVANDLHRKMITGLTLSGAMERDPRIFSDFEVTMVKTGERSERLPEIFKMLADYQRRRGRFTLFHFKNIIYPIALLSICIIIISFNMFKIIPKFVDIFDQLRVELPGQTTGLIKITYYIQNYLYVPVIIILLWLWLRRYWLPGLHLPILRKIYPPLFASRFCYSIGYQLQAGMTLPEACRTAVNISRHHPIKKALKRVLAASEKGQPLSKALERISWFPQKHLRLIGLSEYADNLEGRLVDIAKMMQDESEQEILNTTRWLEPISHFCISIAILLTILSLYMPLFSIPQVIK